MNVKLDKENLLKILNTVSKFTSNRLNTQAALSSILIEVKNNKIGFYATDLNQYAFTEIDAQLNSDISFLIDSKKIIEFLQLLTPGEVNLTLNETEVVISQGKTKGAFSIIKSDDFPVIPKTPVELEDMSDDFIRDNIPFLLFTASTDDARPVLTGVNFVVSDNELTMVSTDGFRLSIFKDKLNTIMKSLIIPASFLKELIKIMESEKKIGFCFLKKENMVYFKVGAYNLFTRVIDGQFPAYEKVIPESKATTVLLNRQDFLRNVKLISIFARDFSNVLICTFKKEGLIISPKKEANSQNSTVQDINFEGEEQKVAFNLKYLTDLLNNIESKEISIELLRPDAPVVFKTPENKNFIHIIMPVRVQE